VSTLKKAIVTAFPGYEELYDIAKPSIQLFARKHSYDIRAHADNATTLPPAWNKIIRLIEAFRDGYDVALWLDADLVIINPFEDISVPDVMHQAMVTHGDVNGTNAINAGVWYLRKEALPFLEAVWVTGPVEAAVPAWWEQNTILQLLGIPPVYPYASVEPSNEYAQKLFDLDYSWNVAPFTRQGFFTSQGFRILHAAGCGSVSQRAGIMQRWVRQLGVDKLT
jgi:hypothetical protein